MASLEKNKEILKRFRIVQDQRKTIQETWDHIERLVVPVPGQVLQGQPGREQHRVQPAPHLRQHRPRGTQDLIQHPALWPDIPDHPVV
jgi:hypothetical protein